MKALLIMHGGNDQSIKKAHAKRRFLHERLGCQIDLCIYGSKKEIEEISFEALGGKIYTLSLEYMLVEQLAHSLFELVKNAKYTSIVVADGNLSGQVAAAVADLLKTPCVTSAIDLRKYGENVQCDKMIYNNLICAKYNLPETFVISEKFKASNRMEETIEPLERIVLNVSNQRKCILEDCIIEKREEQIVSPILIVVGMGIEKKEEVSIIREYAKKNGFSFGVSRPVAMRGWAEIGEIIGVSGEIYTPKVTVTVGISGAAAFMAGIEQSEFILSVNSNPDAAIIKQSDAVIVGDYKEVLESVFVCLAEWNQKEKRKDC